MGRLLPLGTSEPSIIALAERLDVEEMPHSITVVRPRHVTVLILLP